MKFHSNFRRSILAGVALIALPGAAFAENEADLDTNIDGVIVTATKRETKLRDTPIAIAVVDAETLKNGQVQSLLDIASSVPTLRMTTFESRSTALTVGIRGIVPNDANQPAREQGVGIYLDGVYLGRQQGLNAGMLDIERVEVLRGPQGTLFGRNTEGGAVSLVTRRPTGEYGLRATAGVSNFNGYNFDGHLDLPEVAGFSVKIDGALQRHDATTKNPMQGQQGWNYLNRRGIRVSALWKPTSNVSALYAYDSGYSESTPFISQLVSYNPLNLPVSTAFPRPSGTISPLPPGVGVHTKRQKVADVGVPQQNSIDEISGHSLHINWEVNPNLDIRSITAYRDVWVEQYDNAGGPNRPPVFQPNAPEGNAARNFSRYSLSDMAQFQRSQEFQFVGSALEGRFDYVVGLYYFYEKAWEEAATPSSLTYVGSNGAYVVRDPRTAGITRGFRAIDRGSVAESESKGIFVHTVYTPPILNDQLKLTLGGRQTWDNKEGTLYKVSNTARNFGFKLKEDRFDPVATVAYDLTPSVNVYGTYSTGYRAGGANSRSLSYAPFASEEVKSFELGLKAFLFDRVNVNLAVFDMDRTNTQIEFTLVAPDPVTGNTRNTVETVNAPGTTDIRGVEFDMNARLADGLRASFAYAYTETNVPAARNPFPASANCPTCGTIQPVYIIYTPKHALSGSVDYTYPMGFADLRFHLDANFSTGTQSFEQSDQKTDDAFVVNGRASLANWRVADGQDITLSVWSRNLLNADYIYRRSTEGRSGTNAIGDYANFNEPRTFGLEVSLKY
ncbi:TonB-dependent receptor [Caulobacter sp. RHG1]|uniref:TonB-dependent receptor n=1 Tax=Caulobacter sp. (strain RHG1) TaxID=2545762 RepID=UPI001556B438|nr:TonB-dependent receptor [Caulobacter sp. RHG1]NQE63572.1 TonB-dependent receptor [Caulobacter sp. RHG1]